MKSNKTLTLSNIGGGIVLMLFLFSFSVVLTLNFRPLYYYDMDKLRIPLMSGYSEDIVRANYNTLIDYNSLFHRGELNFPDMPMSENGKIHFEEVKFIFDAVQIIMIISGAALLLISIFKLKKKQTGFIIIGSALSISIPVVLGSLIALNWDRFFVAFHEMFFNNDYWIFDQFTDPVIRILPDEFFMHCAIMILALVIAISLLLLFIAVFYKVKAGKKRVTTNTQ